MGDRCRYSMHILEEFKKKNIKQEVDMKRKKNILKSDSYSKKKLQSVIDVHHIGY